MTADLLEHRDLALQLHGMLSDIDVARWRDGKAEALKVKLAALRARLEPMSDLPRLAPVAQALEAGPALDEHAGDERSAWLAFKQRVGPAYTKLAAELKAEKIHVPSLRPTNYARNLFHVSGAIAGVATIELLQRPLWVMVAAAGWAVLAWSMEISRRRSPAINARLMKLFGKVAHPHETFRVNSATWYATALLLLSFSQATALCAVAVAVLGVGDPLAAIIGRRFGRTPLMHGRTLEGTLAFVVSAALVVFGLLAVLHGGQLGLGAAAVVAVSAAVAGAFAELISLRLDDNFSIPLSAAAGSALALWAMGLPAM